eukprot:410065-Pelagomonas_calceolata.AAC.1
MALALMRLSVYKHGAGMPAPNAEPDYRGLGCEHFLLFPATGPTFNAKVQRCGQRDRQERGQPDPHEHWHVSEDAGRRHRVTHREARGPSNHDPPR